ncbi:MAG: molybdenum cofactor guanylyltransferase [Turneriella sp.]|nr:molybdenum cofactor guanylyltransferase [Turneriella sp.]
MAQVSGAKIATIAVRMAMHTELTGVVLCGGESIRMGRDKGLLAPDGMTQVARAAALLGNFAGHVVLSLRAEQAAQYTAAVPELAQVHDIFHGRGPLGGLLSVHQKFPVADIFLLACDMPAVTAADIRHLLSLKGALGVYGSGGVFEPLCAFYSAAVCAEMLRRTEAALRKGERPSGLQRLLHDLQATAIHPPVPANLKSENTPSPV